MFALTKKSDALGAIASTLCLIHCFVTPFIFVIQACTETCCSAEAGVPSWWLVLDYFFLSISFLAILWSTQKTSKNWMKLALWASWLLLVAVIVNERIDGIRIPQTLGYLPALLLIGLHIYNRKYCMCKEEEECCTNQ